MYPFEYESKEVIKLNLSHHWWNDKPELRKKLERYATNFTPTKGLFLKSGTAHRVKTLLPQTLFLTRDSYSQTFTAKSASGEDNWEVEVIGLDSEAKFKLQKSEITLTTDLNINTETFESNLIIIDDETGETVTEVKGKLLHSCLLSLEDAPPIIWDGFLRLASNLYCSEAPEGNEILKLLGRYMDYIDHLRQVIGDKETEKLLRVKAELRSWGGDLHNRGLTAQEIESQLRGLQTKLFNTASVTLEKYLEMYTEGEITGKPVINKSNIFTS